MASKEDLQDRYVSCFWLMSDRAAGWIAFGTVLIIQNIPALNFAHAGTPHRRKYESDAFILAFAEASISRAEAART